MSRVNGDDKNEDPAKKIMKEQPDRWEEESRKRRVIKTQIVESIPEEVINAIK